ncbi:hypothetical protein AB0D08_29625, partial [Kitasatospora sp. NPDC048540]
MSMLAAPSAEALAAKRPHGKIWTPPKTPLGADRKPVKGTNLAPTAVKPPAYPVPKDWKPSQAAPPSGSATVTPGRGRATQAGKLPVAVASGNGDSAGPIRVDLSAPAGGGDIGLAGPVIALTDTAPTAGRAERRVTVSLDVKALQAAGWADRARLVALPSCYLATPQQPECRQQTPVASTTDQGKGVVSAEVTLPAAGAAGGRAALAQESAPAAASAVLAAAPAADGPLGGYSASPLAPSDAWGNSQNLGGFVYSFPVRTPPAPGGLGPQVALAYDSARVDGKTSASNAQSSWTGEGWDYQPGFVERSYRSCDKDGITGSGDQCWAGQNATLNLAGHSGTLVRDDTTGGWRLQGDDGSKVEQLSGAANEAKGGEYWKVTTADGVQYFFGLNHLPGGNHGDAASNSVEYTPVYSPNSGDDCYNAATGKGSWCQEGWRWNLDYVVDPHQNLVTYGYQQEVNYYSRGAGQNNGAGTLTAYVRSAGVSQIGYGQRLPEQVAANGSLKPAAKVLFTTAERCTSSGSVTCTTAQRTKANQNNWPDSPLDQACASSGTCTNYSPTFWSPLMLAKIETQVLVDNAYRGVDSWELKHSFPDPGDGTKPVLWLSSIQRTGTNGSPALSLPAVSFTPRELANRVDGLVPAEPAFNRPRIQQITTETGGKINVVYQDAECSRVNNHMPPSEDANTMACMPVNWYLPGSSSSDPVHDWFHKYLVKTVTEQDAITGDLLKSTGYSYGGGAAWHRNDSEYTDPKTRTWDDFRGYQTVTVTTGSGYAGEGPRTQQTSTYLRGMNGDRKADGSTRAVTVGFVPYPGAATLTVTDENWRAGSIIGSQSYDRAGGSVQAATGLITSGEVTTATRKQQNGMPDLVARYGSTATTSSSWNRLSDGSWRTATKVTTTDPAHGNRVVQEDDKGDGTAAAPETCTTTGYAVADDPRLTALVSQRRTVAGLCSTSPSAANTVSDDLTLYDGKPFGQAGIAGEATGTRTLDSYSGGQPQYVTRSTTTYDVHGRITSVTGPDGARTGTAYSPATGAAPTQITTTNPNGWTSNVTQDPGRGLPLVSTDLNGLTTTEQYDALGRPTAVWAPGRPTGLSASRTFGYTVNGLDAPSVVTTKSLNEDESYSVKSELYDGLGRLRQTQSSPATGGTGRLISDTVYDSHGWAVKTSSPYFEATTAPSGTVFVPQDSQVPAQEWVTFDGQGRAVSTAFMSYGQQQWVSTTAYPGADRTDSTPPQGGAASTTITDARGRTTQLWQYRTATATGNPADADVTTYTYTAAGRPDKRTDAAGNTWTYGYDLRGRQTSVSDPDTGTTVTAYDAASHVASTTDAKGTVLAYSYDLLGRRTGSYLGSPAPANQLAGWTYDALAKGQLTSSTRYVGGAAGSAYTQAVTAVDSSYRPVDTKVTIPASEGALAGTYTTHNEYTPILGNLAYTELPAMGGLPAEGIDYTYTTTGLLLASGGNNTLVTDVQYDALGRPTRTTVGDWGRQVVSTQQIDWATGRVAKSFLDRQVGTTSLDETGYTYNPAGRITSVTDKQNASATDTQ